MIRKPAGPKLPDFTGIAHRCSASTAVAKFKNQYVALVMRPKNYIAASMALEGEDVVTGASIVINNVVSGSDIAVVNELFCFVDGNGTLVYHSHGGLNDEFDVASYRKLVELIEKSPALSSALF
jgi:hypothetical protein